jgi:hypothetical protein
LKKTPKMPKKLAATLPASVSITFRAKIDGDLARAFPPDDYQCLAENLCGIFREALLAHLERAMDLVVRHGKPREGETKELIEALQRSNELDIQMLKRFMDDQDSPIFVRLRTHDGKVYPDRKKIKAYLKANREFRKYKAAKLAAGEKP